MFEKLTEEIKEDISIQDKKQAIEADKDETFPIEENADLLSSSVLPLYEPNSNVYATSSNIELKIQESYQNKVEINREIVTFSETDSVVPLIEQKEHSIELNSMNTDLPLLIKSQSQLNLELSESEFEILKDYEHDSKSQDQTFCNKNIPTVSLDNIVSENCVFTEKVNFKMSQIETGPENKLDQFASNSDQEEADFEIIHKNSELSLSINSSCELNLEENLKKTEYIFHENDDLRLERLIPIKLGSTFNELVDRNENVEKKEDREFEFETLKIVENENQIKEEGKFIEDKTVDNNESENFIQIEDEQHVSTFSLEKSPVSNKESIILDKNEISEVYKKIELEAKVESSNLNEYVFQSQDHSNNDELKSVEQIESEKCFLIDEKQSSFSIQINSSINGKVETINKEIADIDAFVEAPSVEAYAMDETLEKDFITIQTSVENLISRDEALDPETGNYSEDIPSRSENESCEVSVTHQEGVESVLISETLVFESVPAISVDSSLNVIQSEPFYSTSETDSSFELNTKSRSLTFSNLNTIENELYDENSFRNSYASIVKSGKPLEAPILKPNFEKSPSLSSKKELLETSLKEITTYYQTRNSLRPNLKKNVSTKNSSSESFELTKSAENVSKPNPSIAKLEVLKLSMTEKMEKSKIFEGFFIYYKSLKS